MNILGLDLSLTATGVALPSGDCHTIRTRQKEGDRRLAHIHDELGRALNACAGGVDLAVVEDLPRTAHGAGITGMVHGVVRLLLVSRHIPYALLPPANLKKYATGNGAADKPLMAWWLLRRAGLTLGDDNQVDAWWLRAAGHQWCGEPTLALPDSQVEQLGKGKWPLLWPVVA